MPRFDNDVDRRFLDDGNLDPDSDPDQHQQKKRDVYRQRRPVSDGEIREPGSKGSRRFRIRWSLASMVKDIMATQ